jgi:hypothetical protein
MTHVVISQRTRREVLRSRRQSACLGSRTMRSRSVVRTRRISSGFSSSDRPKGVRIAKGTDEGMSAGHPPRCSMTDLVEIFYRVLDWFCGQPSDARVARRGALRVELSEASPKPQAWTPQAGCLTHMSRAAARRRRIPVFRNRERWERVVFSGGGSRVRVKTISFTTFHFCTSLREVNLLRVHLAGYQKTWKEECDLRKGHQHQDGHDEGRKEGQRALEY